MIVKHNFSNVITNPKREHFFEFFTQSKNAIDKLVETLSIVEEAEDEFEELDELEGQTLEDIKAIGFFATGGFSVKPAMFICARDVMLHITKYNKLLNEHLGFGMFFDEKGHDTLNKLCTQIIAELCYLLWFEFDMELQLEKLGASEEYIDEIVKMYCDSFGIAQKTILEFVKNTRSVYPFHLSIFDDYPEFEAEFEAIMGPYLGSLIEKDLTLKQIKDVINGNIKPEELIEQLSGQEIDDMPAYEEIKPMNKF